MLLPHVLEIYSQRDVGFSGKVIRRALATATKFRIRMAFWAMVGGQTNAWDFGDSIYSIRECITLFHVFTYPKNIVKNAELFYTTSLSIF